MIPSGGAGFFVPRNNSHFLGVRAGFSLNHVGIKRVLLDPERASSGRFSESTKPRLLLHMDIAPPPNAMSARLDLLFYDGKTAILCCINFTFKFYIQISESNFRIKTSSCLELYQYHEH